MMPADYSLADVAAYDDLRNDENTHAIRGQTHEQYKEVGRALCTYRVEGLGLYAYWPAH